jgi:glycosyltransferase involved in cell wall biosynthesis
VSPARFEELMRRAAVIVVPLAPRDDRSAGQTTFVNAMARGKAVIVSATPGTDEYVSNGDTGVLVPPADPVALCRAIERLIDDPALARRIAERARSYARDQLSPQRYVGKVLNIIDSMPD